MAVPISLAQATLFSKPSILLHRNAINGFSFFIPFSSSSAQKIQTHKWRQPVVSVLELGGVKIGRDDVMFIVEIPLIQLTTLFFIRWKVFVSSFQVIGSMTSGMDDMSYAAEDLKKCLEGLVQHLFGELVGSFRLWGDRARNIKEKW
uniref:Uncharacterized protein n=1 Tax=Vitis vinifera TaxID=29760 RepID=F6H4R3_VITVI